LVVLRHVPFVPRGVARRRRWEILHFDYGLLLSFLFNEANFYMNSLCIYAATSTPEVVALRHSFKVISIITPFVQKDARFLLDAYVSFSRTSLEIEWLIQEDGINPVGLPKHLLSDPRVSYRANYMHLGAGGTRTMALLRAKGDLVVLLDADDVLAPGALEIFSSCFTHDIKWAYGQCVSWLEDSVVIERSVLKGRKYGAGELLETARGLGHLPMYSLPGCYKRELLEHLGGWPSIPRDEDTTVQLSALAAANGVVLNEVVYIKRQHPERTSVQPWMDSLRRDCRSLVVKRLGLDLSLWENWLSGDKDPSSLYTKEAYDYIPRPAAVCTRCDRVHNQVWCPYCGERDYSSYG
jgi:glycosyltransferase involved in cell wall biosynthesis